MHWHTKILRDVLLIVCKVCVECDFVKRSEEMLHALVCVCGCVTLG